MSTSDKIVKVEHLISKRTFKPIALRFWAPLTYPTVVSEFRFDEGCNRGSQSLRRKPQRRYKQQVAPYVGTPIQQSKSFPLKGEHDE
ncbi:hypothetical protein MTR_5g017665 [Medicago truncatula]|uniref:Uncharacterized protein n=1 Tax=Medicago truncatula TaxID=3880 RepID=A0A072UCM0_MEDTR|nr:hypothetical protein MTR_5g017665 [Medicago truncatula]